ncbi:TonB-dependent receptor [Aureitalea marina]|uniref:TonB-dependent receptor n=1 Tax=Aureitalea marina TaxID=930804 RepID=A0A2S7KLS5_9FLAO|nr:TonB-dependent receptor [Aureitalea marina]PQB03586.1 TonB-dependent receptor [Aureitalea marina]
MRLLLFLLLPFGLFAQEQLSGRIYEVDASGKEIGLGGANLVWLSTDQGTMTDLDGNFSLDYRPEYKQLVISYIGYKTDTLNISSSNYLSHQMTADDASLNEVTVSARKKASARSSIEAMNVIRISEDELLKAACCNLSESFETNPSIDVNFADAVTGTKQIKMLGLTSPYILITNENIPTIRGAAQTYGLSFIPGTWVESLQVTKGAGSVVNGFESITGQINAELRKPKTDKPVFVNLYAGANGRLELNTHLNTAVSEKWSTGLYLHGNYRGQEFDRNGDGFLDVPIAQQINVMNRWQYTDAENGLVSFINVRYLNDEKQTGQEGFDPDIHRGGTDVWGSEIDTRRIDVSAKLGYVDPDLPYHTAGVQLAFSDHKQESYFGLNTYDISHQSWYANAVYNSIISDSRHKIKTGLTFTLDRYDERVITTAFNRIENSLGGYFEYAFDNLDRLTLTAGIRADVHNRLGFFLTPRVHARYSVWEGANFRVSAGRGKRSANIFTENQQFFSSSRMINITNAGGPIYGLDPEIAWNYGLSFSQSFNLFGRRADIILDYYRTDFQNQVVVDWEDPRQIRFYNLEGDSFADSFQAEFNYEPFERTELRFAYKFYDLQTDYRSGTLQRPLTPPNRFFANAGYQTQRKENGGQWKFDVTYNWLDNQRYPSTVGNPPEDSRPEFSPQVNTVNAQVTKVFTERFEVYLGGENITNFRQTDPIISADDPFGPTFDTTLVYGPVFGSMYYAGLRFNMN